MKMMEMIIILVIIVIIFNNDNHKIAKILYFYHLKNFTSIPLMNCDKVGLIENCSWIKFVLHFLQKILHKSRSIF